MSTESVLEAVRHRLLTHLSPRLGGGRLRQIPQKCQGEVAASSETGRLGENSLTSPVVITQEQWPGASHSLPSNQPDDMRTNAIWP